MCVVVNINYKLQQTRCANAKHFFCNSGAVQEEWIDTSCRPVSSHFGLCLTFFPLNPLSTSHQPFKKIIFTPAEVFKTNPSLFDNTKLCLHQWSRFFFFFFFLPRVRIYFKVKSCDPFFSQRKRGKGGCIYLVLIQNPCSLYLSFPCSKGCL